MASVGPRILLKHCDFIPKINLCYFTYCFHICVYCVYQVVFCGCDTNATTKATCRGKSSLGLTVPEGGESIVTGKAGQPAAAMAAGTGSVELKAANMNQRD